MELKKALSESDGTMKTYGAMRETNRSRDKGANNNVVIIIIRYHISLISDMVSLSCHY